MDFIRTLTELDNEENPRIFQNLQNSTEISSAFETTDMQENSSQNEPPTFLNGNFDLELVGTPFPSSI